MTHFTRGKYREEERVIGPALTAIETAYDILLALPDHDTVQFFTSQQHQRAAAVDDQKQACRLLLSDILNYLKFFWWTSAFKARHLAAALVHSYNHDNLLAWSILARSSLEYAAVTYYFMKKLSPFDLKGPEFRASQLKGAEEVLLAYVHGTRFNWPDLFAGNRNALAAKHFKPSQPAINVVTALEHLAKRDNRYTDIVVAYSMLSDFAHPNMASHAAVLEMPTVPGEMHVCKLTANPGPLRGEFVAVASLPWVSTGIGTIVELLQEASPFLSSWLNYLEDGVPVSIDFSK